MVKTKKKAKVSKTTKAKDEAKARAKLLEVKAVLDKAIIEEAHHEVPVEEKHAFVNSVMKFFGIG
jgi:hypothetical protein